MKSTTQSNVFGIRRWAWKLIAGFVLLAIAWCPSLSPAVGPTPARDIRVQIYIVRGQQESGYFDTIDVTLTPTTGLPSIKPGSSSIVNSGVILNSKSTLSKRIEGRVHRHYGLFRTGVQTLQIYVQRAGDPPIFPPGRSGSDIKPMATAVIDVPDNLSWVSPSTFESVQSLRDVELRWRAEGPPTTYEVKAKEYARGVGFGPEVFRRVGVAGDRLLIPAATFEAGKMYCFQVIGGGRNFGSLSGYYAPGSSIGINTYIQCFISFTAK